MTRQRVNREKNAIEPRQNEDQGGIINDQTDNTFDAPRIPAFSTDINNIEDIPLEDADVLQEGALASQEGVQAAQEGAPIIEDITVLSVRNLPQRVSSVNMLKGRSSDRLCNKRPIDYNEEKGA